MFGFRKKKNTEEAAASGDAKRVLVDKIRKQKYEFDRKKYFIEAVCKDWDDVLRETSKITPSFYIPDLLKAAAQHKKPRCLAHLMAESHRAGVSYCHKEALSAATAQDWPEGVGIIMRGMKRDILYSIHVTAAIEVAAKSQSIAALKEFVRQGEGYKYHVARVLEKYGTPETQKEMFFYLSGSARNSLIGMLARQSHYESARFLAKLGRDPAMTRDWAVLVLDVVSATNPSQYVWLISANLPGYPVDLCVERMLAAKRTDLIPVLIGNGASPAQVGLALLRQRHTALALQVMEEIRTGDQSEIADMQALAFALMQHDCDIQVDRVKPILRRLLDGGVDIQAQDGKLMELALRRDKSQMLACCLIERGFDIDAYRKQLLGKFSDNKIITDFIKEQADLHLRRLKYKAQGYQILQDDILLRRTPLAGGELMQLFNFTTGKLQVVVNTPLAKTSEKAHNGDWLLEGDGRDRLARIFTVLGGDPQIAARVMVTGLGRAVTQAVAHKKALVIKVQNGNK